MRYCPDMNAIISKEYKLLGVLATSGYLYLFKGNKLLPSFERIYEEHKFSNNETSINSLLTGILL